MNHAKTSFSTDIFARAIIILIQYLATQRREVSSMDLLLATNGPNKQPNSSEQHTPQILQVVLTSVPPFSGNNCDSIIAMTGCSVFNSKTIESKAAHRLGVFETSPLLEASKTDWNSPWTYERAEHQILDSLKEHSQCC
jgi:hypothetical protein